jgi:hypothetical protein
VLSLASVRTKHPVGWLQRITGHLKVSIFIFIPAMLAAGSVVAQENSASSSPTSTTAEAGFNLDYGNDQMAERAIDERMIDRLVSFDPSDSGRSVRNSVSVDLEHEDSDWNFEVTVTVEF